MQRSIATRVKIAATTTDTGSYHSATKAIFLPQHDGTTGLVGTTTLTASGWQSDLSAGLTGARYGLALAIEQLTAAEEEESKIVRIKTLQQAFRQGFLFGL
jgi:hypothetical protein